MHITRRKHLHHYRHYLLAILIGLLLLGLHESITQDRQPSCDADGSLATCAYPVSMDLQVLSYFH
ncbi:hypothetical protein [Pseudomonas panipatensis]|uniref:Uncharacterized protein n=1 Tax=Pseudomonas panipatensis TaxID=428992 RepID=A0A1G8HEJ4_9PSED|nr:hypothetical protein [Pseudomonas panipatensis]SDI04880.1 hypothetical protein SAMN05216272_105171 [Pseudomonas panipatensis]SMP57709.1 hypothetical protein SAMN06295951_104172 [Pseudomonas panipatensis]